MKRLHIMILTSLACMGLCAIALYGCGQEASPASTSSSPTAASPSTTSLDEKTEAVGLTRIGTGSESVQVTNETEYDIIGIRIKPSDEEEYSANNSFVDFDFANGSSIELAFDPIQGSKRYDVLLLTSEDSKIAIRNIELEGVQDLAFHFEEGIGFVTYNDPQTGASLDNKSQAIDAEENALVIPDDVQTQKG